MKVTEVMTHAVVSVSPGATIKEAARIMVEAAVSALPVLNHAGALVGIVSEADLIPEARADPRALSTPLAPSSGTMPRFVRDVMTRRVVSVTVDTEVSRATRIMLERGIKRVPVVSARRVVGMVSRRDLVRVIARRDADVRGDLTARLEAAGLQRQTELMTIHSGIVVFSGPTSPKTRRLAESVALATPGVLEVQFPPKARGG